MVHALNVALTQDILNSLTLVNVYKVTIMIKILTASNVEKTKNMFQNKKVVYVKKLEERMVPVINAEITQIGTKLQKLVIAKKDTIKISQVPASNANKVVKYGIKKLKFVIVNKDTIKIC